MTALLETLRKPYLEPAPLVMLAGNIELQRIPPTIVQQPGTFWGIGHLRPPLMNSALLLELRLRHIRVCLGCLIQIPLRILLELPPLLDPRGGSILPD